MKRLNYFQKAQIKLTIQYFFLSLIMVIVFSLAAITIEVRDVSRISKSSEVGDIAETHRISLEKRVSTVHRRFMLHLLGLDAFLLLLVSGAGYYHSGRTLDPIREMMQKQEEFASDVSHELRTPLTTINMEIEACRRSQVEMPDTCGALLESIEDETRHMADVVNGLLMLVRSDLPDESNNRVELDLSDVALRAIEQAKVHADVKYITVGAKNLKTARILGNQEQIKQAVLILLDNALRYTLSGGTVAVTTESSGNWSQVAVADTGVGILEEDRERIFERLYRVNDVRLDAERRTGLGLSIARKIAESHGGTISVSSTPGSGSIFTIRFPRSDSQGPS
jgi:signal transduction histidine kinase